jgi:hypothetical protein
VVEVISQPGDPPVEGLVRGFLVECERHQGCQAEVIWETAAQLGEGQQHLATHNRRAVCLSDAASQADMRADTAVQVMCVKATTATKLLEFLERVRRVHAGSPGGGL